MWKMKQNTIERGNPLFAVMQITSAQCETRLTSTSEYPDCHILFLKQADNYRVRELVKKIENHPHRQSLQRDLQQNKAYNPFSATSKKRIPDMGNVELFELFETDPKTQCKECLSYWSEGIVYCTCGHLLKESAANRGVIQYTLDLLSIPNNVIKKGRPHGHRYGKTPQQNEYHQAHNLKKRCTKRVYQGIHDGLFNRFRISCIPGRT